MIRYSDGLLPGHIYMLYWLGKYANRRIPAYFEYDYGIHFVAEKEFLKKHGYLNDVDKPTELGKQAVETHYDVVEERHPKPLHESKTPVGFTGTNKTAAFNTRKHDPWNRQYYRQRYEAYPGRI